MLHESSWKKTAASLPVIHRFTGFALWLILPCNVRQSPINVERTSCTSMMKYATLNNVKPELLILRLMLTTLDNFEITLSI